MVLIGTRPVTALGVFKSTPEVRALCSTGITRHQRSYDPVRLPPGPPPKVDVEAATLAPDGSPSLPEPPCVRAVPTTPADRNGCTCRLLPRLTRPSPNSGRVGIRIVLFEACSGFTRVTARTLAQPPKAAFVTGLRRGRLPGHAARQLPAQSTTRWVEPSSTGVSRLRGAPEFADICSLFEQALSSPGRHVCTPLRSGKSAFVSLGPATDTSRCSMIR